MNIHFWVFKKRVWGFLTNWYKNLSVRWSEKERKLQQSIGMVHYCINDVLVKKTDHVDWGLELDSFEVDFGDPGSFGKEVI